MQLQKTSYLLLALLWCMISNAQEQAYIHYGVEDGLPSSEVYQATQDKRGYMWFATDRGLVQFNGYEFKVLTTQDGLESDVIFGFHNDHNDRTWFYTYAGGIGYLDGDSIIIPTFNNELKKRLGMSILGSMYVDLNDTIWLSETRQNRVIKITPDGEILEHSLTTDAMVHISRVDSAGIVFGYGKGYDSTKDHQLAEYSVSSHSHKLEFPLIENYQKGGAQAVMDKKYVYCTLSTSIISFQDSMVDQSAELPGRATLSLFKDSDENVWVGLFKGGVVRYKQGDLKQRPNRFLEPYSVSSIYESKDGALWFTSLDAGIFFISGQHIYSNEIYDNDYREQITSLSINDQSVWAGTKQGNVYKFDSVQNSFQLLYDDLDEIEFIFYLNGSHFIGTNTTYTKRGIKNDSTFFIDARIAYCNKYNDSLWIYTENILYKSPFGERVQIIKPPKGFEYKDLESISRWKFRTYVGGKKGLYRVSNQNREVWEQLELPTNCWVVAMDASSNHLLLATKNNGLIIMNENEYWSVTEKEGLPINHLESIASENDSTIWVGSKKGVSKIILNYKEHKATVVNIDANDGLISNEVNQLCINNGKVWVATNGGLTFFDTKEPFFNQMPPDVYIEQIKINGAIQDLSLNRQFTDESIVFDFHFTGLNYRSLDRLKYKYRLQGFDSDWNVTSNRQVRYMLPHGDYSFEVLAQNNSGVWSETPATYSFNILPPFWLNTWFITTITLAILFLSIAGIKWRWNALERRRQLEVQMAKSQHMALTSQLKPHFIFNALNSIHNFIRKNDKEASSKYLILFSKLIRQILDNSNESIIRIDQEISLLKKYLEIEQLRFKDKMTYEVNVGESIDQKSMKIPTQIIQPYVENAIWHGIMNKEGGGHIQLNLFIKDESLNCVVEDNGIGRKAVGKIEQASFHHKSCGMNIGSQRLSLIAAILKKPANVEVMDITDDSNMVIGTRVSLTLPILGIT